MPGKKYTAKKAYKFQVKILMFFCIPEAMGKGEALTDLERGRIQGLHEAGLTGRVIAHAVNRSRDAVMRVVSGHVGRISTSRRQHLSDRALRVLVRTAASGNFSATQLHHQLELKCSVRTVRRILQYVDWLSYTKWRIRFIFRICTVCVVLHGRRRC